MISSDYADPGSPDPHSGFIYNDNNWRRLIYSINMISLVFTLCTGTIYEKYLTLGPVDLDTLDDAPMEQSIDEPYADDSEAVDDGTSILVMH